MTEKSDSRPVEELGAVARQHFYLPGLRDPLEPLSPGRLELDSRLASARDTAVANLRAVLATASLPGKLVASAVLAGHYRFKYATERMLDYLESQGLVAPQSPEARKEREERLRHPPSDPEADALAAEIGRVLVAFAHQDPTDCVPELLRQCTVLLWGSFEVCGKDAVAVLLNSKPSLCARLLDDPRTRRNLDSKAIGIPELEEFGFDLSAKMGAWYTRCVPTWSIQAFRDSFSVLCSDEKQLHEVLGERDMWLLHQHRHLVVHSAGIVDTAFVRHVGEELLLGTKVTVPPVRFFAWAELVVEAAAQVLRATSRCLTSAEAV